MSTLDNTYPQAVDSMQNGQNNSSNNTDPYASLNSTQSASNLDSTSPNDPYASSNTSSSGSSSDPYASSNSTSPSGSSSDPYASSNSTSPSGSSSDPYTPSNSTSSSGSSSDPYASSNSTSSSGSSSDPYASSNSTSSSGSSSDPYASSNNHSPTPSSPSPSTQDSSYGSNSTPSSNNVSEKKSDSSVDSPTHTSTTHIDRKSFDVAEHKVIDALPQIVLFACILWILVVQNLAEKCRQFCKIDSSSSNSIFSGLSLGYLVSKGLPILVLKTTSMHSIQDIYLKRPEHLLLTTFFFFGIGFLCNYFLEKKSAKNITENIPHSFGLYFLNTALLCVLSFIVGFHLLTYKDYGVTELLQFSFFASILLFMEISLLGNMFTNKNPIIRKILLSIACIGGYLCAKTGVLSFSILTTILSLSFMVGFFVFSTIRVEMAIIKRNSNYVAFIISFVGLCALTIIQSLYESVRC
ncbi:MAG: hypothetical protein HEEMFOPI_00938 [Holosporales bacterium]